MSSTLESAYRAKWLWYGTSEAIARMIFKGRLRKMRSLRADVVLNPPLNPYPLAASLGSVYGCFWTSIIDIAYGAVMDVLNGDGRFFSNLLLQFLKYVQCTKVICETINISSNDVSLVWLSVRCDTILYTQMVETSITCILISSVLSPCLYLYGTPICCVQRPTPTYISIRPKRVRKGWRTILNMGK